jgi:hypothetical protein
MGSDQIGSDDGGDVLLLLILGEFKDTNSSSKLLNQLIATDFTCFH